MTTRPSLLVEVEFTAGVWTDLTESIDLARTEIVTTRGRASQSDDGQPGTFSCVFENLDGALTPDNPAGTYYPNVVPGKRLRYTVGAGPDRTNLVKYPSAESGTTGWTGTDSPGMTFAVSSAQSYSGTKSYECTSAAAGVLDRYGLHMEGSAATPGTTYTGSVYVRAASTTASAYVTLIFWNSGGGFISATGGAVSADSSTAWGRRTVTATAPAGTAFVTLGIIWFVAAAGEVHYFDAAMIEEGSTVGAYFDGSTSGYEWTGTAHASTSRTYTNTRFLGRIVSWDPSYTGNADGDSSVAVTAKDTLGTLQDTEARYPLAVLDALDLDPVALFPLSGEGPAARVTSLFDSPRTIPVSTAAGATGEITYNSSGGPADDMGFLAFGEDLTGKTITDTSRLLRLTGGLPSGATLTLWLRTSDAAAGGVASLQSGWSLGVSSGRITLNSISGTPSVALTPGVWHHVAVTQASSGTTTLYVDGTSIGSGSGGTGSAPFYLYLGYNSLDGLLNGGDLACVSVYDSTLSAGDIATSASFGPVAGVTTAARVERIAALAGLSSAGTGGPYVAAQRTGSNLLDAVLTAARGSSRIVYDDEGTITYRSTSAPSTVSVTYDAEADLDGPPTWGRSSQGRLSAVTASSAAVGERSWDDSTAPASNSTSIETALYSESDLTARAQQEIARGRDAKLRLQHLVVDLVTAQNSVTASTLALVLDDRVRVSNLPSSVLGWTYQDGHLLGMTERASIGAYVVEMDLGPADAPAEGLFEDATYGRWGVDDTATVGALTSSDTTVVITSAGTPFTTAAGSYPLDVDINGERVTLNSAPGGASSPQTFTGVTRGVAPSVARAHSAGEAVDVWHAARFTT